MIASPTTEQSPDDLLLAQRPPMCRATPHARMHISPPTTKTEPYPPSELEGGRYRRLGVTPAGSCGPSCHVWSYWARDAGREVTILFTSDRTALDSILAMQFEYNPSSVLDHGPCWIPFVPVEKLPARPSVPSTPFVFVSESTASMDEDAPFQTTADEIFTQRVDPQLEEELASSIDRQLSFWMIIPSSRPTLASLACRSFDDDLEFVRPLGRGSFGTVGEYRKKKKEQPQPPQYTTTATSSEDWKVAVKTFSEISFWWREVTTLAAVSAVVRRAVPLHAIGMFFDGLRVYYYIHMPVLHPLPTRRNQRLPAILDRLIWRIYATLLEAVTQLHHPNLALNGMSEGLVHGDIKPGNLLWDQTPGNLSAILTDFSVTTGDIRMLRGRFGTRLWRAPEVEDGSWDKRSIVAAQKTDVWSSGLVILSLILDKPNPFREFVTVTPGHTPEGDEVAQVIRSHVGELLLQAYVQMQKSDIPEAEQLYQYMALALDPDPQTRPTSGELFGKVRDSYVELVHSTMAKRQEKATTATPAPTEATPEPAKATTEPAEAPLFPFLCQIHPGGPATLIKKSQPKRGAAGAVDSASPGKRHKG